MLSHGDSARNFKVLRQKQKKQKRLLCRDDADDDESIGYVRPLLQLKTVTSVLMIRSDEEFGYQITTERGWKVAAA